MAVSRSSVTGTWHYSVYLTASNGSKVRKRKDGFRTKKEAQEAEDKVVNDYALYSLNSNEDSDITLEQMYKLYKEKLSSQSFNTQKVYESYYTQQVISFFKPDTQIKSMTPSVVLSYRRYLANQTKLSNSTKNLVIAFVKGMIQYGVKLKYLKTNPFDVCEKFKLTLEDNDKKEELHHQVWDMDQFNKFISTFDTSDRRQFEYKVLFTLLYDTGMRINECLSLTWSKLDGNQLTIDRQAMVVNHEVKWCQLKTPKSKRTIYITDYDRDLLYQLKELKSKVVQQLDDYFIFGKAKHPASTNAIRHKFLLMTEHQDLPKITLHGFRHSHASLLFKNSMDIAYISRRLGHSNIQQTLKTYTHFLKDTACIENDKVSSILSHS